MKRSVNGNNITLSKHILQLVNTTAANLLLNLRLKRLVVVVQKLLAVERLQTAQHTLTNTANGNGTNDLILEVELVLGNRRNIPLATANLLVCRDKVADQGEDGHDNMLGDGDDIGPGDLGHGNATVGLVGSVQVDMVRANTGSDGELQVLSFGQALGGQVTGVEATMNC